MSKIKIQKKRADVGRTIPDEWSRSNPIYNNDLTLKSFS